MFLFESEWEGPLTVPPVEILPKPPDKIIVRTPYNPYFVEEIKQIPTRRWTGEVWEVSNVFKEEVEKLVKKYFPTQVEEYSVHLIRVVKVDGARSSPEVDGIGFVSFSRDWIKVYNKGYPHIEILYEKVKSGGSRRHPAWFGKIVFLIAFRKDPIIYVPKECELITYYKGPTMPTMDVIRKAVEDAKADP